MDSETETLFIRLYENLAFLIRSMGVKIGEVEDALGVSRGYISRLGKERGTRPGIEFILKAAKYFNVSVESLMLTDLRQETPTEKYYISFMGKLIRETNADKLNWLVETKSELMSLETFADGSSSHPFMKMQTVFEEDGADYPMQMEELAYCSRNFGAAAIKGDCYHMNLANDVAIYIMNASKGTYREGDPKAFVKEIWLFNTKTGEKQYITDNFSDNELGRLTDILYKSISTAVQHPHLSGEFKGAIDGFMAGNSDDGETAVEDDEPLPFE